MRLIKLASLLALCLLSVHLNAQTSEAYTWKSMAIGGGGFVSAIIPSTTESGLMYARTDVGGAYRWDKDTETWIPLNDWVSDDQTGYLGIESLALDPNAPNKVYMLVGISYFNNGRTAILRSNDYGENFDIIETTTQFRAHGNGMGRQTGEKLQVDPNSGHILYLGTRANGLFKSTDSGSTWARLTSLPITTTPNENGISFVLLDPSSSAGGVTQRLIVGVSRFTSDGDNLYISNDAGQSFTPIAGAPVANMPQRAVLASDGHVYIAYADGAGPHGHWQASLNQPMENGQLWKYNLDTGVWTNVTPSGFTRAIGGISVDPNNPQRLVASSVNTYMQQYSAAWGDRLFLSTDGGASWTDMVARGFSLDNNGVSWINGHAIHWAGSIEFNPFNTQEVWVTSGNGVFRNSAIDTSNTWSFAVTGLEETVPLGIVSIPNGPMISVIGDYDGFVHHEPDNYGPIHTPRMGTTTGLDMAAQNNNMLVRVGNEMYYSMNQASSWTHTSSMNGTKGQVAILADGSAILHSPENSSTSYRSTNLGNSWAPIAGLSLSNARIVADPVNVNKAYAYNPNGSFWVSTDGGVSFSAAASLASNGSKVIRVAPEREGDIWVALHGGGLVRSTNSGASFSAITGVSNVAAVGFGKAAPGSNYPAVYIWGTVNGVRGAYRSTNTGGSWVRVNDADHQFGGPGNGQFIVGDMNTFGVVYMSTAGRGVVYGVPTGGGGSTSSSSVSSSSSLASSVESSSSSSSTSSSVSSVENSSSSSSAVSSFSSSASSAGSSGSGGGGGGHSGLWVLLLLIAVGMVTPRRP